MSNPQIPQELPRRYLLTGGHIYSPVDPFATSMMVVDGHIVWIGSDAGAHVHQDSVDDIVDLHDCLVTPAFVDAHVHATATGLGLVGLDLSDAHSAELLLTLLREHCTALPRTAVIWGHGWDDTDWMVGPPTRRQIDEASDGRIVYLSRVDVHSGLVSSELLRRCSGIESAQGFHDSGHLRMAAHLQARAVAFDALDPSQRGQAQQAALLEAARHGIASIHEMAGPGISSAQDLQSLLALGMADSHPEVIGYWGALHDIELARELGAIGCAGDLFVDGSLGSHTACLRTPYADQPDSTGVSYLSPEQVGDHIVECTNANLQAGFHVIGDQAMDIVCAGITRAGSIVGPAALRRAGHRLEHTEMVDGDHLRLLADMNVTASMQPAFDAAWGGRDGMYARRLGMERASTLNPFAEVVAAGVPLAFGSDAPVTALRPWEAVRAAAFHRTPEHRISTRASFLAHTRGGRRAARQEGSEPGVLREGTPATFAIWRSGDLVVSAPDDRVASWSTDPRSGTPGLPDLLADAPAPGCLLTVRAGKVIHHADHPTRGAA